MTVFEDFVVYIIHKLRGSYTNSFKYSENSAFGLKRFTSIPRGNGKSPKCWHRLRFYKL